jgi:predicted RecA/RadA family phage recombinase
MAKNYVQPGDVVTLTAPSGGVASGAGVVIGNLFAIATGAAAEGEQFEGQVTGCWRLPKAAGQIAEGAAVWWDATPGEVINTSAAGAYPIGTAIAGAATDDTSVVVRLSGIPVTAAAG